MDTCVLYIQNNIQKFIVPDVKKIDISNVFDRAKSKCVDLTIINKMDENRRKYCDNKLCHNK